MKIKDAIKRTIASNIRRARIATKMTQAEAAKKLGITAQAISNYERGINGIENSLLIRMCEIYNTNMIHIVGEEYDTIENPIVNDDGISKDRKELIDYIMTLPEDQIRLLLQVARSIR